MSAASPAWPPWPGMTELRTLNLDDYNSSGYYSLSDISALAA